MMPDSTDERLDRLIGLFEMAYREPIAAARAAVRSDRVVAAILDAAEDWVQVGVLKASVAKAEGVSEKTVQRRIADLLEQRLLKADGAAGTRRVKVTGLV